MGIFMNNKMKTILGLLAFVLLIGGAYFAYNNLSSLYKPGGDQAQLAPENGQAFQSSAPAPDSSPEQSLNTDQNQSGNTVQNDSAAQNKSNSWKLPADKSPAVQNNSPKGTGENAAQNSKAPGSKAPGSTAPNTKSTLPKPAVKAPDDNLPKAADFTVENSGGKSVKLSSFFGKPIVVNFWASWCPPCRSEMPNFDKAYADYKGKVTFIMVDLVDGQRETVSTGKDYISDQGFTFPVYFDTQQSAAYAYKIQSIPMTLFIDKGGHIVKTARGAMEESTLRSYIESIR